MPPLSTLDTIDNYLATMSADKRAAPQKLRKAIRVTPGADK
jgi:hypothetical protein